MYRPAEPSKQTMRQPSLPNCSNARSSSELEAIILYSIEVREDQLADCMTTAAISPAITPSRTVCVPPCWNLNDWTTSSNSRATINPLIIRLSFECIMDTPRFFLSTEICRDFTGHRRIVDSL